MTTWNFIVPFTEEEILEAEEAIGYSFETYDDEEEEG